MVTKEVDRESRRAAESQGGTTIIIGAMTPLAISTNPKSSPEGSAPLLPTFPPCERCLDYQVGSLAPRRWTTTTITALNACFGCPPDIESPPNGLRPSSPAPKPPPPASEPVSSVPAPEPPFPAPAPASAPTLEPRRSKRILSIPGHYAVLAGRSPRKPRRGGNV
jgi:hypothetical protein